jgi:hypothetical protein
VQGIILCALRLPKKTPAATKEFVVQLLYISTLGLGLKAHAGEIKVETPPAGRVKEVDEGNPDKNLQRRRR